MRYDILGWDGYSVDDDLNIYSSKGGKDKKMCTYLLKNKDTYIIRLRDGKGGCKWFTPQRLYFAATHGIDPQKIPKEFIIDKNCNVVCREAYMETLRQMKKNKSYENKQAKAADTQEKIDSRKDLLIYSIKLQYKAIVSNEYKDLLTWLIGQKEDVGGYVAHYTYQRKKEIMDAWTDSAIYVVDKIKNSRYIVGDIVDRTRYRAEHLNKIERDRNARETEIIERIM